MNGSVNEQSIGRLVQRFYAKARIDPLIGPVFEAAVEDWDVHIARLQAFWSSVMLTSGRYKGNPFSAHRPLQLTPAMFMRWLALWRETADELFEPLIAAEFVVKAERIALSLGRSLLDRPLPPHPQAHRPILLEMSSNEF